VLERKGGIIKVASMAAFVPIPCMAVYGASKAFVLSFSEARWAAYRPHGLRVLCFCPGATDTSFSARSGEVASAGAKRVSPRGVARLALAAFDKNRRYVIHGAGNYVAANSARLLTRAATAKLAEKVSRPKP
jgi:uncharacterized protein